MICPTCFQPVTGMELTPLPERKLGHFPDMPWTMAGGRVVTLCATCRQ